MTPENQPEFPFLRVVGQTERAGTEDARAKPAPAEITLIIAGTRCRYTWPTAN